MKRYIIWDKNSDIYTLGTDSVTGRNHYTAQEYIQMKAPWAANENIKVIVGGGAINGTVFMEFESTKEHYAGMGCDFSACETDDDYLRAMEAFEDNPPGANDPTNEERIAAALEAQVMMALPDVEETPQVMAMAMSLDATDTADTADAAAPELSAEAKRIQRSYQHGLWSAALVNMAVQKGSITSAERNLILKR